jgi:hypothetical protein
MTLTKNRLGAVLTEPFITSFIPSISTVGSNVQKVELKEDDLNFLSDSMGFDDDDILF